MNTSALCLMARMREMYSGRGAGDANGAPRFAPQALPVDSLSCAEHEVGLFASGPAPRALDFARTLKLVCQPVDDRVDAELIGLVGVVDRAEAAARPFPELRDVGVVADEHLQPFPRVVVLEEPAEDRLARVVGLRKDLQR